MPDANRRPRHRPDCVLGGHGYDAEAIRQGLRERSIIPFLRSATPNTALGSVDGDGRWKGRSLGRISSGGCAATYPSRALWRFAGEGNRMGAPSANDEADAGNGSPAVGRGAEAESAEELTLLADRLTAEPSRGSLENRQQTQSTEWPLGLGRLFS